MKINCQLRVLAEKRPNGASKTGTVRFFRKWKLEFHEETAEGKVSPGGAAQGQKDMLHLSQKTDVNLH